MSHSGRYSDVKSFLQNALRSPTVRIFGIATLVAMLAGFLALIDAARLVPMAFQWIRSSAALAFGSLALLLLIVTVVVGLWRGSKEKPTGQQPDQPDVGQDAKGPGDGLPSGLAPTVTLVVAGLAAVGITGDYLTRMVRDEPNWVRVVLIGALIGAAIIAIAAVRRSTRKGPNTTAWLGLAGALVVVAATGGAVILGSVSVSRREQPRWSSQPRPWRTARS